MSTPDPNPSTSTQEPISESASSIIKKIEGKFKSKPDPKIESKPEPMFKKKTGLVDKKVEYPKATENRTLELIDINKEIEFSIGKSCIIDVQPDMRYPVAYIITCVKRAYPTYNIEEAPKVSVLQLMATSQFLFITHIFNQDLIGRDSPSIDVSDIISDATLKTPIDKLIKVNTPKFLEPLLLRFVATKENMMTKLKFIPSLSAANIDHDFGRLIPPQLFIILHNVFCTMTEDETIEEISFRFFTTIVITIGNTNYTVANFLGTYYEAEAHINTHSNWINLYFTNLIEDIFNSEIPFNRSYHFIELPVNTYQADEHFIYRALLQLDPARTVIHDTFIQDLETVYLSNKALKGRSIIDLTKAAATNSILVHLITETTLPTWHINTPPAQRIETRERTDREYATDLHILTPHGTPTPKAPVIIPERLRNLSLVSPARYTSQTNAAGAAEQVQCTTALTPEEIRPTLETVENNISAATIIMNPNNEPYETLSVPLVLGIRIENSEIDSLATPTIHPRESVVVTNSQYLSGAVLLRSIRAVKPQTTETHEDPSPLRIPTNLPFHGVVIRDMSKFTIARSSDRQIPTIAEERRVHSGYQHVDKYVQAAMMSRIFARRLDETEKLPRNRLRLWSSYRFIETFGTYRNMVYLLPSLRPIIGTTNQFSASDNIERLYPTN